MLNWYANTFRISEDNIMKSGLRRAKILTWLTLMIVPVEIVTGDWLDENAHPALLGAIGVIIIVALMSLLGLLLSPLVHRFWAPDKYLDEWEIEVKRKGMSAGYKVLFGALAVGLIYSAIFTDYSDTATQSVSYFRLDSLAFAVLILSFGIQTLVQLQLIRPIDEDDVETDALAPSPFGARIAVVFVILMLFVGPAFVQGFVEGWTYENSVSVEVDTAAEGNE